jgi:YesN/AraC family two-component response regulator
MLVEFNTFDDSAELSEVLYLSEVSELCERLSLIVDEFEKKLLHFEVKCANLLSECILDAIRLLNTAGSRDNRDQSIEILDYIRENFNKPLTNKELGERFGYHPNYLNRLIKDATGMSLHGYVISVRMLHAIKLLENTTLSIGEIAEECGFCDLAYFSQYFKKYFGKNPTEYRKS